jgi:carbamate kinase
MPVFSTDLSTRMLVVVAVGGNALLQRGEVPLAETQEKNVAVAVGALAPLAADLARTPGDRRAPGDPHADRERCHRGLRGGGGAPVLEDRDGHLRGAEAVVDKDLSTALLARDLDADALVILTDVANVEAGFGTDAARAIGHTTPAALRALKFPAGSMGPKVEAACRFVEATDKPAMIGRLDDAADLVRGTRGTVVEPASQAVAGTRSLP